MDSAGYQKWLLSSKGLKHATCLSRVSNCAKVERYEGDLDAHYSQDRLASLLERLTYTIDDERHEAPPRHQVPIKGNVRRTTATLKSAVTLYRDFRDTQHLDVLLATNSEDESADYQHHILWGAKFLHRYAAQLEALHSDALFGLLTAEVDRQVESQPAADLEDSIDCVFSRCEPQRRFGEMRHIVEEVVAAGYRERTAYVSVCCAMKILDVARGYR